MPICGRSSHNGMKNKEGSAPRGDGALPFYSKEIYSIDDFILWDISHM